MTTTTQPTTEASPAAATAPRWHDAARVGLLVVLVLLVFLPETPLLRPVPPRDSGMFLYGGQQMNAGRTMYLDYWDHKPPLIFAINALGLRLGGGAMLGVYALEALALAAAVALSYAALKPACGAPAAFFGTALWSVALTFAINGNQIEEWALPLQFGVLYAFTLGERRARGGWPLVVCGALVGLLFFLRPNLIGIGVALGAFLLLRLVVTRRTHDDLRLLQCVVGGLAVLLVVVAVFALSGTLPEMWFAAVTYNTLYASNAALSRLDALRWGLGLLLPSGLPVFGVIGWVAGVGALGVSRRLDRLPPLLLIALVALPLELLLASLSARRYDHYYVAPLPALAVPAAYVGAAVFAGAGRLRIVGRPWLWAGVLTVAVALLPALALVERIQSALPLRDDSAIQRVVAVVREQTQPGDSVLIWGAQPLINFMANRPEPSRYFFHSPLFMQGYASESVFATFLDDLRANPPPLIIDTAITDRGFGPLDPERRAIWMREVNGRDPAITAIPEIDVIYDYFAAHYERIGAFSFGWDVYRRLEAP